MSVCVCVCLCVSHLDNGICEEYHLSQGTEMHKGTIKGEASVTLLVLPISGEGFTECSTERSFFIKHPSLYELKIGRASCRERV